jgi:hypothetical protein
MGPEPKPLTGDGERGAFAHQGERHCERLTRSLDEISERGEEAG